MATAATSSKRRKFSGEERDRGRSGSKSGRSETSKKHSKRSHKKSHHRSRDSSLRVKSIPELAKLVSSGAVRLPKSLIHYEDDRAQLLDQVFTILSPYDIKGMLPDILKDLRAKQIKQLCYEQLKNMSREDIRTAIHREDSSEMDTRLNSMFVDLLGQDTPKGEDRESSLNESTPQSKSGEVSLSHENSWERGDEIAAESGGAKMEEFVIRVSDVSDDERDSSPLGSAVEPSHDKRDSDAALESEDRLELTVRATGDDIDRELCGRDDNRQCSSTESDKYEGECHGNDRDSSSDLEDYWDDDDLVGVPETARLLEMEFRKRALESELRRSGTERKEEVVPIMMEEESVDKGTLLELKLRQRALQALLVKKKTDT